MPEEIIDCVYHIKLLCLPDKSPNINFLLFSKTSHLLVINITPFSNARILLNVKASLCLDYLI